MFSFRRFAVIFIALAVTVAAQTVPLDALLRGGRIHYQGGRYERAREQFQKALDQYSATADAATLANIHLWLGMSEAQLNQLTKAAENFRKALQFDSTIVTTIAKDEQQEHWVWTALITASRENYAAGKYEEAITYARAAINVNPAKSQGYSIVANSYSALGKYEEMLATARQMLALNTASAEAYSLIGLYFLQRPDSLWPTPLARKSRWDSTRYYYNEALKIYQARMDSALQELATLLKITDTVKVRTIANQLIEKQRYYPPEELRRYIEKELGQAKQLPALAQISSRLFYAANNLNVTSSRLGSALLRASTETKADTADRYRAQAESLFNRALFYDRFDYTTLFNLGISQYQARNDSLALTSFARVVEGTTVPLNKLPAQLRNNLITQISSAPETPPYIQLTGNLITVVDSTLFELGYRAGNYSWFYFPDRADTNGMFLSNHSPTQLENIYLLLGISQTGLGLAKIEATQTEAGKTLLTQAIPNLILVTKINPQNADAYLNLVYCYRETGNKTKAEWAYETYKKLSK